MDLRSHAVRELALAGVDPQSDGFAHVMELLEVLLSQVHPTVGSTRVVVAFFYQLCNGEPLTPLAGTDDEWDKVSPFLYQNNRCPRVYKELGVGAYDSMATVFVDELDRMFTKQPQSRRIVHFPYTPETKYVHVKAKTNILLPPGATTQ